MAVTEACQCGAHLAGAVIGAIAGNDPFLGRLAAGVLIKSGKLGGGLNSFRSRCGEKDMVKPRRQDFCQPFGQPGCDRRSTAHEAVIIGELLHLLCHHPGQAFGRESQR